MNGQDEASEVLKILILEDEPDDAGLIQRELRKHGFNFEARLVDDRPGFTTLLEEFRPDIVLSDYSLPNFSGMEALQITQEKAKSTPFIYVTGAVGEVFAADTILHGAWGFVLKSNLKRLPQVIEDALNNSSKLISRRLANSAREMKGRIKASIEVLDHLYQLLDEGIMPSRDAYGKIIDAIKLLEEISNAYPDEDKKTNRS